MAMHMSVRIICAGVYARVHELPMDRSVHIYMCMYVYFVPALKSPAAAAAAAAAAAWEAEGPWGRP